MKFTSILLLPALATAQEYKRVYHDTPESAIKYYDITTPLVEGIIQEDFIPVIENNLEQTLVETGYWDLAGASLNADCESDTRKFGFELMEFDDLEIEYALLEPADDATGPAVREHDYKAWWSGNYIYGIQFAPMTILLNFAQCSSDANSQLSVSLPISNVRASLKVDMDGLTRYTGASKISGMEKVKDTDKVELTFELEDMGLITAAAASAGLDTTDIKGALYDIIDDTMGTTLGKQIEELMLLRAYMPLIVNDEYDEDKDAH